GQRARRAGVPGRPARGARPAQLHGVARRVGAAPDAAAAGGSAERREQVEIEAPSIGGAGSVIGYGHYGRPVLLFPAEQGRAWDLEGTGMIAAVADLIEAGRAKLYT